MATKPHLGWWKLVFTGPGDETNHLPRTQTTILERLFQLDDSKSFSLFAGNGCLTKHPLNHGLFRVPGIYGWVTLQFLIKNTPCTLPHFIRCLMPWLDALMPWCSLDASLTLSELQGDVRRMTPPGNSNILNSQQISEFVARFQFCQSVESRDRRKVCHQFQQNVLAQHTPKLFLADFFPSAYDIAPTASSRFWTSPLQANPLNWCGKWRFCRDLQA